MVTTNREKGTATLGALKFICKHHRFAHQGSPTEPVGVNDTRDRPRSPDRHAAAAGKTANTHEKRKGEQFHTTKFSSLEILANERWYTSTEPKPIRNTRTKPNNYKTKIKFCPSTPHHRRCTFIIITSTTSCRSEKGVTVRV